ncbi:hypothetical protein EI94DRAFT_1708783, partial [Lactarius quietus]
SSESHTQVGQRWLDRYLEWARKTTEQLNMRNRGVLEAFSREWSIIPTPSLRLPTLQDVTDEVACGVTCGGEALESFVVHTTGRRPLGASPPYAHGRDTAGVAVASAKTFGKTIILPIAVPGVGKSIIAVALAEPW